MMVAVSIVVFSIAVADKKSGWIWAGINLCISMLLGKYYGLSISLAIGSGFLTFLVMFLFSLVTPKKMD